MKKKNLLGKSVIFYPQASDREARENGATNLAAIVSQTFDGPDNRVNLRIFSHSTDGRVPLRQLIPSKEEANGIAPYYELISSGKKKKAKSKNIASVSTSRNEEGVGPETQNSIGTGRNIPFGQEANSGTGETGKAVPNDTAKSLINNETSAGNTSQADKGASGAESSINTDNSGQLNNKPGTEANNTAGQTENNTSGSDPNSTSSQTENQ